MALSILSRSAGQVFSLAIDPSRIIIFAHPLTARTTSAARRRNATPARSST